MAPTCVDFGLEPAEFKDNGHAAFEDMIPGQTTDRPHPALPVLLESGEDRQPKVAQWFT
ncbi:MAG: hypothetical protein QGF67_12175 [Lentisphaeria bacterium]|jgi:hypothetical protein|nr:hypothetical protein [Lentisphaeria bacterium]MDP7742192.1 hypothetical protein [Lentisphaeria bacterium]